MTVAVIPCFDVAPFCEKVIRDTLALVPKVIVIDDGSTDGTTESLKQLNREFSGKLECIFFPKNQGKGYAILAGLRAALPSQEVIVFLDGDGQHNPCFIAPLAEAIRQGADLAIGSRDFDKMPLRSHFGNLWIAWLLKTTHAQAPKDTQSGMRAMSLDFAKMVVEQVQGGRYETEFLCLLLALDNKKKIVEIPIHTIYIEKNRYSHFFPLRDTMRILKCFLIHKVKRWKKYCS